jgi:hypothetical protein
VSAICFEALGCTVPNTAATNARCVRMTFNPMQPGTLTALSRNLCMHWYGCLRSTLIV